MLERYELLYEAGLVAEALRDLGARRDGHGSRRRADGARPPPHPGHRDRPAARQDQVPPGGVRADAAGLHPAAAAAHGRGAGRACACTSRTSAAWSSSRAWSRRPARSAPRPAAGRPALPLPPRGAAGAPGARVAPARRPAHDVKAAGWFALQSRAARGPKRVMLSFAEPIGFARRVPAGNAASSGPDIPHCLIAAEEIEQRPQRLAARARERRVARQDEPGVVVRRRRAGRHARRGRPGVTRAGRSAACRALRRRRAAAGPPRR